MNYILVKADGKKIYPYSIHQLRIDNSNTSFPENLDAIAADWNCYQVTFTEQPAYNPITHTLTEDTPILQSGVYYQSWQVVPYTLERAKQNKLAAIESEWMQLEQTGWDCGNGHLGLSASDVALYSGAFALAKEAAALGLPIPPIITKEDNQINFATIQEMTALLLQYGAARSLMSAEFAARRRAVTNAATLTEVEAA